MQPKTLGIAIASVVTAAFLAAVGLVVAWPYLTESRRANADFCQVIEGDAAHPVERHIAPAELPKARGSVVPAKDYALSAPHSHGNLTIFLIHGKETMPGANVITLQEGIEQNLVAVRDNGTHQLRIDNRSNATLFIQGGDIVKGGIQDRTLPYDMLVPAKTENFPVMAMCVEQGRSHARGNEASASFAAANEQLPTRALKLAAYRNSQPEVWDNVRALQTNIAKNAGGSVQAPASPTSLQLTLEQDRVQLAVDHYLTNLAPILEGKNDVIGFAVVINGQVQSADVYGSNAVLQKLWPKLIRATAVEALAERRDGHVIPANAQAVHAFLVQAEKGNAVRLDTQGSTVIRHETGQSMLHDTCDPSRQNAVMHRSVLAR
ncbi:MAG: hypothetical protein FJ303_18090 [Planctomycetes bacterium]|nr:hypothetical protein [Planctomycetota bacterium]